ncbi:Transglutaminase-like superfamily protein [Amycolatopsis marina]|uniref:Transglutaminase-like superfamily protein n=1 Tax=Amycolatopsis marina TaxID=490629 RepID=A0A1I0XBC1_9PSEU|nr:lasso peptide biosynthesis B2 protein [Amycolatopsis marina]SFA98174.1 Transglutaminase-like superfamily protein [Amycolatopsis marina]
MTPRRRVRLVLELLLAVSAMMLIEISLRTSDLPTTCRRLGVGWDLTSAAPAAARHAVLPRRTRPTVGVACFVVSRWPAGDTCLRRCLLIGYRLRNLGPVLRIGVRRDANGEFSAHSWLEIDGASLDPAASAYAALGSARR